LVAGPPWKSGRSEKDRDATDKATSKKMARVTARISHLSFDALDAHAQSVFWAAVLGFAGEPDDPDEPGHEECMIFSPDGNQRIQSIAVPDAKEVKNRPAPGPGARGGHPRRRAHPQRVLHPPKRGRTLTLSRKRLTCPKHALRPVPSGSTDHPQIRSLLKQPPLLSR
jgi:hypothetical protein